MMKFDQRFELLDEKFQGERFIAELGSGNVCSDSDRELAVVSVVTSVIARCCYSLGVARSQVWPR